MFGFEIFIGAIKRLLFFLTAANIDAPFCERNKTDVFFWIRVFALRLYKWVHVRARPMINDPSGYRIGWGGTSICIHTSRPYAPRPVPSPPPIFAGK